MSKDRNNLPFIAALVLLIIAALFAYLIFCLILLDLHAYNLPLS